MHIGRGGFELNDWRFAPRLLPSVAVLLLVPALIGLGLWQLDRAAQKQALLDAYQARRSDLPIAQLPPGVDGEALRFRHITLRGMLVPHRELLLDNRTYRGQAGFHLWGVLRLRDGRGVLVDRGWLPLGPSRQQLPPLPERSGAMTVTGVLDRPPAPGLILGPDDNSAGRWPRIVQRIDLDALSHELGYPLAPLVIVEDAAGNPGLVHDWHPLANTMGPGRHQAYAVQWFAMAATLVILYLIVSTHRRNPSSE